MGYRKLDVAEKQRRAGLAEKLRSAWGDMQSARERAEAAIDDYNTNVTAYNEMIEEIVNWKQEIVDGADEYASDKSDKWNEGDNGQAHQAWKEEYENFEPEELETIEVEFPDQPSTADDLETLPEGP